RSKRAFCGKTTAFQNVLAGNWKGHFEFRLLGSELRSVPEGLLFGSWRIQTGFAVSVRREHPSEVPSTAIKDRGSLPAVTGSVGYKQQERPANATALPNNLLVAGGN